MKKFVVVLFSILSFLILLLWLGPYLFKDKITLEAKNQINDRVNADISFDGISLNLIRYFPRMGISFDNIKITGKDKFKNVDLLTADELTLGINPWKIIFEAKTDIKRLKLVKPRIHIVMLDKKTNNFNILDDTLSYEDTTSSLNLAFEKLTIENGMIIYEDHSSKTFIEMVGVEHIGKINLIQDIFEFDTKTSIKEFTCDYAGMRYSNKKELDLNMQMIMNKKDFKFTFKENSIWINHFKFSLNGSFTLLNNGFDMDLKFAASETSFKNIVSLIPGIYKSDFKHIKTDGTLAFKGFVKGIYADSITTSPCFHVDVLVKDGYFKIDTLPTPVKNIQMDLTIDNSYGLKDSISFNLKKFQMELGKHSVHGRFRLTGLESYKKIDTDIFANLDMSIFQTIYPIPGLSLKGKINFELIAKGDYFYSSDKIKKIPSFHLDMKVERGKIKYDSLPSAIDNIRFQLLADNPSGILEETLLRIEDINLELGKNPFSAHVHLKGFEKYWIDATVNADLDMADLERIYPIKGTALKGIFDMNIKTKGIYDHEKKKFPSVDAKIQLKNGWVKSSTYPEPIENINLKATAINNTGNFKDTHFNIDDLTYTMENEPFEVKGKVTDMDNYAFDLKIKGRVDLEKLTKIYPIDGVSLKGIIDSDFETKGKVADIDSNAFRRIKSDGTINVQDFELKSKTTPTINIKDAHFSFTPEKMVMDNLEGRAGKSNFSLKGELTNYMVFAPQRIRRPGEVVKPKPRKPIIGNLILICDTLDLNEWKILNSSSESSSKNIVSDTSSSVQLKISERLDFTFDSKIGFIIYDDIRLSQLVGEIKFKDGIMSLKETGFNTLNARFNLTGDYDTRNIKHPIVDFNIDIKDLDIKTAYKELGIIRELAPAAGDAEGSFSLSYKLKGEVDQNLKIKNETMTGGGEVRIANAKINGMKIFEEISKTAKRENIKDPHLKDFSMTSEIRDNKIFVKPFSLHVSGFNTEIEGVSDLSGTMQYIFLIELLPIEKLRIPFHISGTYDNPKVALGKGHSLPD